MTSYRIAGCYYCSEKYPHIYYISDITYTRHLMLSSKYICMYVGINSTSCLCNGFRWFSWGFSKPWNTVIVMIKMFFTSYSISRDKHSWTRYTKYCLCWQISSFVWNLWLDCTHADTNIAHSVQQFIFSWDEKLIFTSWTLIGMSNVWC